MFHVISHIYIFLITIYNCTNFLFITRFFIFGVAFLLQALPFTIVKFIPLGI